MARRVLLQLGGLLSAIAILCAVILANYNLVQLAGKWCLLLSVPLTAAAGCRMWMEFTYYADGYWSTHRFVEEDNFG